MKKSVEKTALIFLGGEEYEGEIVSDGKIVVACDRAFLFLRKRGIKPDVVVGDFDSLGFVPEGAEVYPSEKDQTDFALAVDECEKIGIRRASVYCAGGGREDHFLANVGIAINAYKRGILLEFITNYSKFFIAEKRIVIPAERGQTVSVLPLFRAKVSSSHGLKYPYRDVELPFDSSLGVSNVALEKDPVLEVEEGLVLVFVDNGREVL